MIRDLFRPFLKRVRSGDIVWIHNRPEFAVAIAPLIHRAGGRVVLHLHNSHLVNGPERLMEQVRVDRLVFVSEFLLKQAQNKFPCLGTLVLYITVPIRRSSIQPWIDKSIRRQRLCSSPAG